MKKISVDGTDYALDDLNMFNTMGVIFLFASKNNVVYKNISSLYKFIHMSFFMQIN